MPFATALTAPPVPPAAAPVAGPLVDRFGRVARDLRISVTDRCNLRCSYCMPAEGLPWQSREEHLSSDELVAVVAEFARLGVRTVRLTGGEPLLRRDLPELIAALHALPGIDDVALTTNGVLLERRAAELAAAGGARLNVSIDSADPELFRAVTRRDDLARVLRGLEAARAFPQFAPLKLNAVALRGVTEPSLDGLLAVAAAAGAELRFIEPMPLDAERAWSRDDGLTRAQLRELLEQRGELIDLPTPPAATARRWELRPHGVVVGCIASVSEPFCAGCDRLRLTADGQLRACLFAHAETDLRALLRGGAGPGALEPAIRAGVWGKPRGHGIDDPAFAAPDRPMSRIGG